MFPRPPQCNLTRIMLMCSLNGECAGFTCGLTLILPQLATRELDEGHDKAVAAAEGERSTHPTLRRRLKAHQNF
jgi:hypothetical protein